MANTKTLPPKERCTPMFTALFTITRHGNIDLGSLMLSNSDTERHTPEALKGIPHGKKNTERIDNENGWVVARFGDGGGKQV